MKNATHWKIKNWFLLLLRSPSPRIAWTSFILWKRQIILMLSQSILYSWSGKSWPYSITINSSTQNVFYWIPAMENLGSWVEWDPKRAKNRELALTGERTRENTGASSVSCLFLYYSTYHTLLKIYLTPPIA